MRAPRLVYILSKFPCYDEAFLLREISGVAQQMDTWIFSLRPADEAVVHDEARPLLPRTLSVPYLFSLDVLRAHLVMLRRRPIRYLRALAGLLAGNLGSPEFLAKNLALFPKTVWLAWWALENGVSHLHAGWATYPASSALVVSELTDIPFSFSGHAHDIYLDSTQLGEKLRRAAFVTTCTTSNATYLRGVSPGVAGDRIAVVHHGVRLSGFAPDSSARASFRILSVGTLHPHKGFAYLIDALGGLAHDGLDFECSIVGGGPLAAALRERLSRAGLNGRVTMTGALTQDEVRAHYRRSSVFVLMAQPEWHWGIPNVVVEALAARNAVITTRFGSVEELVKDGETGVLVPPKDPAALGEAIRRLAGDPAGRERLAAAGHAIIARDFDLDRAIEWYVSRFQGRPA